jgi:hypothetical protein
MVGAGTGSDRWIIETAASSKLGSPDDSCTATDTTLPRRFSTRATFTLAERFLPSGKRLCCSK